MGNSNAEKMAKLFENNQEAHEFILDSHNGNLVLRIDLKAENLDLWHETLKAYKKPCNLLLACESNDVQLTSTKLTWVVGSAIRSANARDSKQAIDILGSLGVCNDLRDAVKTNCPGIGEDFTWAFYLERHGWLAASPILDSSQRRGALKGIVPN